MNKGNKKIDTQKRKLTPRLYELLYFSDSKSLY